MTARNPPRRSLRFRVATALLALAVELPAAGNGAEPTLSAVDTTPHGPVVLRGQRGVTLARLHINADPSVHLIDCHDVTITGCDLRSVRIDGGTGLRVLNSHIHNSERVGVHLDGVDGALIQGNRFERVASGVYAHCGGGARVVGNVGIDMVGPMPRGQLVQFDKTTGPGQAITHNLLVNRRGRSVAEDGINVFQSHGTAESPILVAHNRLHGDPDHGSDGFSKSGSGIMLGDAGGSHQLAQRNAVYAAGQAGIGVAAGGHITVDDNLVLGRRSDVANVGVYVWHQYPDANAGPVTITRNRVAWINAEGKANPFWNGGGFLRVDLRDNLWVHDAGPPVIPPLPVPIEALRPPRPHGDPAELPDTMPGMTEPSP
ncbi:MAG: right-handed parallel beta-helix repeat-containing protein [Planctomycetota bacterium]